MPTGPSVAARPNLPSHFTSGHRHPKKDETSIRCPEWHAPPAWQLYSHVQITAAKRTGSWLLPETGHQNFKSYLKPPPKPPPRLSTICIYNGVVDCSITDAVTAPLTRPGLFIRPWYPRSTARPGFPAPTGVFPTPHAGCDRHLHPGAFVGAPDLMRGAYPHRCGLHATVAGRRSHLPTAACGLRELVSDTHGLYRVQLSGAGCGD